MIERFRRAIAPRPPDRGAPPGLAWSALYPPHRPTGIYQRTYSPAGRLVAASLSSVMLAPANPARRSVAIVNAGTGNLYLTLAAASSAAAFTQKLASGATYVLEDPDVYQGDVAGVWDAPGGSATVTETYG